MDRSRLQRTINGALCTVLFAISADASAYWVRPIFGDGDILFQDGLDVNGVTQDTQSFSDASRAYLAEVDIDNGTAGTYVRVGAPGVDATGLIAYSNALFGETITFNASAPETWDFSLAVDGVIDAQVFLDPNGPSGDLFNIDIRASVAVFAGNTVNNDPENWATEENLASALFYDEIWIEEYVEEGLSDELSTSIDGSLEVNPFDSFDIVVRLWTGCVFNDNESGYCEIDFSNTAGFQTSADPSTFTSTSGTFLGSSATVVPLPAAAWFFAGSLLGLAGLRKAKD